jgi:hypothetical protein
MSVQLAQQVITAATGLLVQQVLTPQLLAPLVLLVRQAHRVFKVTLAQLVLKACKAFKVNKVLLVLRVHKAFKVTLAQRVRQEHRVMLALQVRQAHKAQMVNRLVFINTNLKQLKHLAFPLPDICFGITPRKFLPLRLR